ncbi:MAG TPA: hypothetical protein VNZ03_37700 [Terriglobales bacterium]|nr:hypothetical protein [Terriglobales bacterium]
MTRAIRKTAQASMILLLLLFAGVSSVLAQEESQSPNEEKPKPAGSSFPIPGVNTGNQQDQNDQTNLTPDSTPLTGVLNPTLGSPEIRHSYWVPGVQWSGTIQSNSYNQTSGSGWLMNNFVVGNLSLLKVWSRSQLAMNYSGGGFFSTDSTQGNGSYQQLAFTQTFQWNRLQVQLIDQFSYLPQTSLGFGGGTSLGNPGTGGSIGPVIPGVGNNYTPNQSIYNAVGPRYSNTSVAQVNYATSPRGSITLSGSYGLLNFVQAGNVDNQSTAITVGYNYALTRHDTIGLFYGFSAYHFSGQPAAYGNHSINAAYGRKLTGRLALQIYGGPSFTTSRVSANGNTLSHGINVGSNLTVGLHNGGLTISYSHGISGGSGVLTGSTTDLLNFGANHRLGRIWSGQVNMGYAHNTPIQGFGPSIPQTYNTWNFGGGLNRPFGRSVTFGIAYNATLTRNSTTNCTGANCSNSNQTYNYVTINFQWRARPFVLP